MGEELVIIGGKRGNKKKDKEKKIKWPEIVLSACYSGASFSQRDIGILSELVLNY